MQLTPAQGPVSQAMRPPQQLNIGGILSAKPLSTILAEEATAAAVQRANTANNEPVVTSLAAHIRKDWERARSNKTTVEQEMIEAVYARKGEYTPDKLARIREQGGSEIYMMLFATKARQAKALLADVLIGTGSEKPWTLVPSPRADLPPQVISQAASIASRLRMQKFCSFGLPRPTQTTSARQALMSARTSASSSREK